MSDKIECPLCGFTANDTALDRIAELESDRDRLQESLDAQKQPGFWGRTAARLQKRVEELARSNREISGHLFETNKEFERMVKQILELQAKVKELSDIRAQIEGAATVAITCGFPDQGTYHGKVHMKQGETRTFKLVEMTAQESDVEYVVLLEPGVWLADGEGDPPRTLEANAKRFSGHQSANDALVFARSYRSFKNARILPAQESEGRDG